MSESSTQRTVWAGRLIASMLFVITLPAQSLDSQELARNLASPEKRMETIARLARRRTDTALLLSWTRTPPAGVDRHEFLVGLLDTLGELRLEESIPFLIQNIDLERWHDMNTWLKRDDVVLARKPALSALVKIGAPASKALIKAYHAGLSPGDQVAAVFAVAHIGGPDRKDFLASVLAYSNSQILYAQRGLKE